MGAVAIAVAASTTINRGLSVFVDASTVPPRDEQARAALTRIIGTPALALFLGGNINLTDVRAVTFGEHRRPRVG